MRTGASCGHDRGLRRQGRVQLAALARVRPLERAYAVDTDPAVAKRFAEETSVQLGLDVRPGGSVADVADEITIFDSTGVAIEDVAAAAVYERAIAVGRGTTIDLAR